MEDELKIKNHEKKFGMAVDVLFPQVSCAFNVIWNIALIFNSTQVAIHTLIHKGVVTEPEEAIKTFCS